MNTLIRPAACFLAMMAGLTVASVRGAPPGNPAKPYRFLLVINDQWNDPGSEVMTQTNELSMLCALLKSWGVPFDIYRLDQQRFDAYHLLGRSGRPLYSTLIWDAPGAKLDSEAAALLRSFVTEDGLGLVAFSDSVSTPVIAELSGVTPRGQYAASDHLGKVGDHFITRGVEEPPPVKVSKLLENVWKPATARSVSGIEATIEGATVIAQRGAHPALAVRQLGAGGKVVWFDAERSTAQIYHEKFRELLKRSLVWANGYLLYAEYPRSVLMFMDDMGASDKTFYPGWHYPTLSEETIRTHMIGPLQRHQAVMTQNVITGFADRKTHRILDPWIQTHVVDELDPAVIHDYSSTKRGLDEGMAAGVFEIQSHGWSHISPDLDSPPGPFWSASPTSLIVQQNWYKEFGDYVRKAEIPAIVQRIHMERSLEYLEDDFGVRAISLRCGGGLGSDSMPNNTMRIAAKLGFGLGHVASIYYLGNDLCVPLEPVSPRFHWNYTAPLTGGEIPWTIDAPAWIGFHDRDVAMDAGSLARLLDDLGEGVRYMTFGEYCGYLHAEVDRDPAARSPVALRVRYDSHYDDYFRTHPSSWVLHLSDETRAGLAGSVPERQTVRFPAGLGEHLVAP